MCRRRLGDPHPATHPKKLVVDRLDISQTRSRVNILAFAYFVGFASESA